jgi:hypothetical protein
MQRPGTEAEATCVVNSNKTRGGASVFIPRRVGVFPGGRRGRARLKPAYRTAQQWFPGDSKWAGITPNKTGQTTPAERGLKVEERRRIPPTAALVGS